MEIKYIPHFNVADRGANRPSPAPRGGYKAVVVHDTGPGPSRRAGAGQTPLEAVAHMAATGVLRTKSGQVLGDHYYIGAAGGVVCSIDPAVYMTNHVSSSGRAQDKVFLQKDTYAATEWLERMADQPLPLSPAARFEALYKPYINHTTIGVGMVLGGDLPSGEALWALEDLCKLLRGRGLLPMHRPISLLAHSTLTPSRRTDSKGRLYDLSQEQWIEVHRHFSDNIDVSFA